MLGPKTRDPGPISCVRPGTLKVGPITLDSTHGEELGTQGLRPETLIVHETQDGRHSTPKLGSETPIIVETRDKKQISLVKLGIQELWSK